MPVRPLSQREWNSARALNRYQSELILSFSSATARKFLNGAPFFLIVLCVAVGVGCSGSGTSPGGSTSDANAPTRGARVHPFALVTSAPNGIYLGAQVNPSYPPGGGTFADQEAETEGLETDIGRPLALHMEYRSWSDLLKPSYNGNLMNDPEFAGDIAHGRVPVISLRCLDNINNANYDLYQIAQGDANSDLAKIRTALLTLKYPDGTPYPVMLRYFWEFNLNAADMGNENENGGCFVQPSHAGGESLPTQFINAWGVVHQQLLGNATPLPDITFVWNPNVQDSANLDPSPVGFDAYFPEGQVDWIGADGYSEVPTNPPNPLSFTGVFNGFMTDILGNSQYGQLPILIGETGSCTTYPYPYDQADYIEAAQNALETQSLSPSYARVRGLMYFDAQGMYSYQGTACDWSLDGPPQSPAVTGLAAFRALGGDPNFQSMVTEH